MAAAAAGLAASTFSLPRLSNANPLHSHGDENVALA
ncbi:Uncharacterised protein [Chromobacterium violaceum]|uniref:Uncharacterized protein n=1 Tax=Chromobacterium violaceum TaxID=536 RepID=A0A3S5DLT7_CHRVL|nr:Uncharacterised protein [Chromobacterium violaceum]